MQSCGESGAYTGWSVANSDATSIASIEECPPTYGHSPAFPTSLIRSGLWVADRLITAGGDEAPEGAHAELAFAAQAGTTLTRARYYRVVYKYADDNWQPYIALGDGTIVDTCDLNGSASCNVGSEDWPANDERPQDFVSSYRDLSGISTNAFVVGLRCRPNGTHSCGNGSSIQRAEAAIYSAFFTISDPSSPTLGAPSGAGWTSGAWASGETLPLAIASSDNTGIAATRVYVDGSLAATLQRSCSYDRPRPCTDEPVGAVGLPTAALPDGSHTVQLAAVDAAGNQARSAMRPVALKVDTQAPASPIGLSVPVATSSTNAFAAAWTLPAQAGTPVAAGRYQLCRIGGQCGAVQAAAATTSTGTFALPSAGAYALRVWLVDDLGHADPATAATATLTYVPPVPPLAPDPAPGPAPVLDTPPVAAIAPSPDGGSSAAASPTPAPPPSPSAAKAPAALRLTTVRRVGRRVTIAGSTSPRASGDLTVRYRARVGAHARVSKTSTRIRHGRFTTTFSLTPALARAPSATITVTYGGDADTRPQTRTTVLRVAR